MSRLISFSLVLSRMADFRKFLFRLVVFVVRMWLAYALLLLTFPVPVSENRFAAPLCVFNFGMDRFSSFSLFFASLLFLRGDNHDHASPLQPGLLVDKDRKSTRLNSSHQK